MMSQHNTRSYQEEPPDFQDLIDFHLRWPQFRHIAADLAAREDLPESQRKIVRWLILLANRVGQKDMLDD